MKYFFPALMVLVVLIGLGSSLTPFIAEQFFPSGSSHFRKADQQNAKSALTGWLGASPEELSGTHAISFRSPQYSKRWYRFSVDRKPVELFIKRMRLGQLDMNDEILSAEFLSHLPPVTWWQPQALQRKSYFSGHDGTNRIKLIYHATEKTGYLLIETDH